jgi:hypothetical protein
MSAERLEALAAEAGLACIGQEIVNWLGGRFLDCISLLTPPGSPWERPNVVVHNPYFMAEAASSALAALAQPDQTLPAGSSPSPSSTHRLGPLASIAATTIGPWGISVVGPLPRAPRLHGPSSFVDRRRPLRT